MTRIGVVGAGRVGAVLAAALRSAGHDIVAVAGESNASRTRIETLLPGVHVDKPSAVARACDLLLLTVPDDMLGNVVAMLSASGAIRDGQYVVHTSGRHGLAVLDPAAGRGAHVLAMHPAMTFTGTDVDLDRLTGCVFGVTAADDTRALAESLVAGLGGTPVWVPEDRRTLYHAGLAHGANHLVTLVNEAADLLRAAGVDRPERVLSPLLHAALDNALRLGDAALTGPVSRGDAGTVGKHLDRLPADAIPAYLALARRTADRAIAAGRLRPADAALLMDVLSRATVGSPS
jgi:predicted short-subunit dehydrogenase-like oxidoreductase (DUF2520 family)